MSETAGGERARARSPARLRGGRPPPRCRVTLSDRHDELVTTSEWDFSDLRAVIINCTLKRSPEVSNTAGLLAVPKAILETTV